MTTTTYTITALDTGKEFRLSMLEPERAAHHLRKMNADPRYTVVKVERISTRVITDDVSDRYEHMAFYNAPERDE